MKLLIMVMSIALLYGFARFMHGLIKELAEFAVEAWHSGETEK